MFCLGFFLLVFLGFVMFGGCGFVNMLVCDDVSVVYDLCLKVIVCISLLWVYSGVSYIFCWFNVKIGLLVVLV